LILRILSCTLGSLLRGKQFQLKILSDGRLCDVKRNYDLFKLFYSRTFGMTHPIRTAVVPRKPLLRLKRFPVTTRHSSVQDDRPATPKCTRRGSVAAEMFHCVRPQSRRPHEKNCLLAQQKQR